VTFWYNQGFTLPESAEIMREGQKDANSFSEWLSRQTEKKRKKIFAILLSKGIKLKSTNFKKDNKQSAKDKNVKPKIISNTNKEQVISDFYFVGGSYQNLDTRYLPLELRNHSLVFVGQSLKYGKWIIEKRDTKFLFGAAINISYIHLFAGNRYKPVPNFYFAKDPNFFSNFDRIDSFLSQPLKESYFAGINLTPTGPSHMFGIYSAKSVSVEPGFYYVSTNKSYAITWAPYTRIGSIFINDTYKNIFSTGWQTNVQGEGIGRTDNYIGFIYLRGFSESQQLKVDATVFRDNQLLSLPASEMVDKSTVKQDLGFSRIRYRDYFAIEGLRSNEGLRYESGYGVHLPIWYGDLGGIVLRYRDYTEDGFYKASATGRGVFYEYRKEKTILSLGGEFRDRHYQAEAKVSIPLTESYYFELSCLYRDKGIVMRSWFENWSYATDFNMNLVDRKEIWKLKFVGPEISMNVSISEKTNTSTYIYYANFQFNHKF
jgi:hypothetical protein